MHIFKKGRSRLILFTAHVRTPEPRLTSVGMFLKAAVSPIPSWPLLSNPQHLMPPPVMSAHVCEPPAGRVCEHARALCYRLYTPNPLSPGACTELYALVFPL